MPDRLLSYLPSQINSRIPRFGDRRFIAAVRLAMQTSPALALKALSWWAVRKRMRAWNLLTKAASTNRDYYQRAIGSYEKQVDQYLEQRSQTRNAPKLDLTCIVFAGEAENECALQSTLDSIHTSLGRDAQVILIRQSPSSASELSDLTIVDTLESVSATSTKWVLPIQAGDRIANGAAKLLANAIADMGQCQLIYWDEDVVDDDRRENPWFKASWDQLLFLARDFLSGSAIVRADAFVEARQLLSDARVVADRPGALAVALASRLQSAPCHLPFILTHRHQPQPDDLKLRQKWFDRLWPEKISFKESANRYFAQITFADPKIWPTVSIIIPTRDRSELLASCLEGLGKLSYPGPVEIVVVDNGSRDEATLRLLRTVGERDNIKVIRDDGPFNFSRLNNLAARQAKCEFLCLLNNDVEPVDGEWLTEMIRYAVRPNAGAVGAMLVYPDGSIQHAGVTVGLGGAAGHSQRYVAPADSCNFSWHGISRSVSVVTAACLLIKKSDYLEVGGLDERNFAVAFNDVDLCLKLARSGRTNVYVSTARLIHHESLSRGSDFDPANRRRFESELQALRSKWKTDELQDEYYHPIFSRTAELCVPAL